jgi:FAD/FMN-containing dehydrogenase
MRFNLHIVIEDVEEVESKVREAIAEFNSLLSAKGHKVVNAILSGDRGQTNVTPPPPAEPESEPESRPHSTLDAVSA